MRLLSPLAAACLLALAAAPAQAEVFINELHYDDSTPAGDVGEAIGDHPGGFALLVEQHAPALG